VQTRDVVGKYRKLETLLMVCGIFSLCKTYSI